MEELDDLEDFNLELPTYEVWALGYIEGSSAPAVEQMLTQFTDPDDAVVFVDSLSIEDILAYKLAAAATITRFDLEVETAVGDDAANAGVIYRKKLTVNNTYFDINISESDISITKDGLLCITNQAYPVGTVLRVNIFEDASRAHTCTIIYKVAAVDENKIFCTSFDEI
jgi:hypothetical protein